MTGDNTPYHGN